MSFIQKRYNEITRKGHTSYLYDRLYSHRSKEETKSPSKTSRSKTPSFRSLNR